MKFVFEISKNTFPTASTFIRAVVVETLGTVTVSVPSFGVVAARVTGKVVPPSVESEILTFAQLTGGYSWFPQFDGEIPGVFKDLTAYLRNQYSLSYTPSAGANDGKFHKVKVELVSPDGSPLSVTDQKGKKQKLVVYAREGYTAVKGGVGD